jgi:hypothetical protein
MKKQQSSLRFTDHSVQTETTLPPTVSAEFITYEEFFAMKQEKEEIDSLLQESLNTVQLLKEKVRL